MDAAAGTGELAGMASGRQAPRGSLARWPPGPTGAKGMGAWPAAGRAAAPLPWGKPAHPRP